MELQCQEQSPLQPETAKPVLSSEDLIAQQQFAQSIPVIEREGKHQLWIKAQQK